MRPAAPQHPDQHLGPLVELMARSFAAVPRPHRRWMKMRRTYNAVKSLLAMIGLAAGALDEPTRSTPPRCSPRMLGSTRSGRRPRSSKAPDPGRRLLEVGQAARVGEAHEAIRFVRPEVDAGGGRHGFCLE